MTANNKIVDIVEDECETFDNEHLAEIEELLSNAKRLFESCREVADSWSGSFAGWHGRMYFGDYERPALDERFDGEWGGLHSIPDGWEERSPKEVTGKLEKLMGNGFSVKRFEERAKAVRVLIEDLHSSVNTHFSALVVGEKEKNLVAQIESYEVGATKEEYIRSNVPNGLWSRDTKALHEGIYPRRPPQTPPLVARSNSPTLGRRD